MTLSSPSASTVMKAVTFTSYRNRPEPSGSFLTWRRKESGPAKSSSTSTKTIFLPAPAANGMIRASSGFLKILPTKATWFCKRPIWTLTVSAIGIMDRKTSGTLRRITLLLCRRSSGMRYRRFFWRAVNSLLHVRHRCPPSRVPAEISIRLRINYSALFAGRSSTTNGRIKARTNIGLAAQM